MPEREVRYRIVGDASSAVAASKESSGALEQFSGKTQEAGKQTEKFNFHGREAHAIMHKLNEIAPGLGTVLKGVFNPEAIGMVALILALDTIVKLIEKQREKTEELKKQQVDLAMAAEEANKKVIEGAREYAEKLKEIESKGTSIKEQEDLRLKILNAQNEVTEKLAKSEEARALISEQNAKREMALKEALLAEAKNRASILKGESADAENGASSGVASSIEADVRIKARQAKIEKAIRNRQDLESKGPLEFITPGMVESPLEEKVKSGEQLRSVYIAEARKAEEELKQADEADAKIIRDQALASKRAERKLEAYEKATEDVAGKQSEANAASAVFDIRSRGRSQVALKNSGFFMLPAVEDNPINERLSRAIEAERAIGRGDKIDKGQGGDIQFLSNVLHSRGETTQQILAILKDLQRNDIEFAAQLQVIATTAKTRNLNHGG